MKELFDVIDENGAYTGEVATREECHQKGLWHKAIAVLILSPDNKKILLQKRSPNKKLWPNLWDHAAGGHVLKSEFGYQAAIRETKEEIGIDIKKDEMEFIGCTTSKEKKNDIINNHYNEFYIVHIDTPAEKLTIQNEEVQEVKWFEMKEIIDIIKNDKPFLTGKKDLWNYLIKYIEITQERQKNDNRKTNN